MMPGSAVKVRYCSTFSSAATDGDTLRHADAQVDHAAGRQFQRGSAGDDLALVQQHRLDAVERHAQLPREGGAVRHCIGLPVVLRLPQHDAVHQDAGHLHLARIERAGCGDPFHLRDDEAARILRRHRRGQAVERQRLPLHRDVAGDVRRGAADQRDVDREGLVEQPLAAGHFHQFDKVFRRYTVDLAAVLARIDEGTQTHPRQQARALAGDVAVELGNAAKRQIIRLDLVIERQAAELRHQRPMSADGTLDQPLMRETIEAAVLAVAGGGGEHQRQAGGLTRFEETLLDRDQQFVRRADADEAGYRHRITIPDDGGSFGRRNNLVPHCAVTRAP